MTEPYHRRQNRPRKKQDELACPQHSISGPPLGSSDLWSHDELIGMDEEFGKAMDRERPRRRRRSIEDFEADLAILKRKRQGTS